nr:hypothetical protein [Tanacetum cinerariifolium]
MANNEAKSTTRKIVTNEQENYYSGITSITVNGKKADELKRKFLDDLHKNAFSGTNGEDAVEHIKYFLKILDPIDLLNVNQDKLRVVVFSISLVGDAWRFETNLFNYKTPLCEKFKEFNYLLKIDHDLLTKDIEAFKTYEEFKDDWIYEWNKDVPWVLEKPWMDYGAWKEPTPVTHCCQPFNYKTGCSEWPTCSWRNDGYCNGGNLPGAYIIGNSLHYQDYEWYESLKDEELKEEALRNKVIMEGIIDDDDESSYERQKRWNVYNDTNHDHEYEMDHEVDKRYEKCSNETHELPVCNIRRFEMIKYSFGDDEEYVVVK